MTAITEMIAFCEKFPHLRGVDYLAYAKSLAAEQEKPAAPASLVERIKDFILHDRHYHNGVIRPAWVRADYLEGIVNEFTPVPDDGGLEAYHKLVRDMYLLCDELDKDEEHQFSPVNRLLSLLKHHDTGLKLRSTAGWVMPHPPPRPRKQGAITMSKCARCGSYQYEKIIDGKNALVCRDNGHTVFEVVPLANATPYEEKPAANADLVEELEKLFNGYKLEWSRNHENSLSERGVPTHDTDAWACCISACDILKNAVIETLSKYRPVKAPADEGLGLKEEYPTVFAYEKVCELYHKYRGIAEELNCEQCPISWECDSGEYQKFYCHKASEKGEK
jgi:hypothetical protein